jgi:hypothetical protein
MSIEYTPGYVSARAPATMLSRVRPQPDKITADARELHVAL